MGAKEVQLECRKDANWKQIDSKKGCRSGVKTPALGRCQECMHYLY